MTLLLVGGIMILEDRLAASLNAEGRMLLLRANTLAAYAMHGVVVVIAFHHPSAFTTGMECTGRYTLWSFYEAEMLFNGVKRLYYIEYNFGQCI